MDFDRKDIGAKKKKVASPSAFGLKNSAKRRKLMLSRMVESEQSKTKI